MYELNINDMRSCFKLIIAICCSFVLSSFQAYSQNKKVIEVKTKSTSLVYAVTADDRLIFQYYGKRVDTSAFMQQKYYPKPDTDRDFSYDAYPTFGLGNINEPALRTSQQRSRERVGCRRVNIYKLN